MMYRGYGMFGGSRILCLIIIGIIGIISYFIIKHFNKNKNNSNTVNWENGAIDLFNERYAKGEIDEEEYNIRKQRLRD